MKKTLDREKIRSVLITRTDNIGDVILTLPLLYAARQTFPNARIYFFVKNEISDLLEKSLPDIDVVSYQEKDSYSSVSEKLSPLNPDLVIFAKPEFDLALMQFLLSAKYRTGTAYRWYSFLFTDRVKEHRKSADKHESQYNLNLLYDVIGEEINPMLPEKYLRYDAEEKLRIEDRMHEFGMDKSDRYIIIHPGSRGSAKDISSEQFRDFASSILKMFPALKIVYTGTDNEANMVMESLPVDYADRVINLCGKLSLRELMILIDDSELFISNSTGPAHIAGAMNKNVITFFPNSAPMNSTRWRPLGSNTYSVSPGDGSDNMALIRVEDVVKIAAGLISNSKEKSEKTK